MNTMLRAGVLGLALTLSLGACKRREAAPSAPAKADSSAVSFQKIDTTVGTAAEATPGKRVTVNYTGWLYLPDAPQHHGEQFDSSVGRKPFTFQLGSGMVIPGWDQGVAGMKVGGKRTLVIPAALGYGAEGGGPIPPNANLIFDVELLDVQ
ncbi:FKBP-type peptidyl-prolyl cis-trans isomerase [Massilia sp. TW-1]|uniref:Peptidyl-prolyl cis-trans isomerase n=1 Tax=Telluria antibiotica TaxID=2717319 RepID=A0ABX0PA72_9BURK|nr:FKBP-type peptidyl-prolyl cis-trans isomerase [Telluria antibiotica]NIA53865.1 FKBP-type peptidyl-prolyl cis-trans isomerase [Telluria antibiotica]